MNKISTVKEYKEIFDVPGIHIIKVSASWCGPCRTLASTIEELPDEIKSKFIEVSADEAEDELLDLLHVKNIPLLICYNNGVEYNRKIGVDTKENLLELINDTNS